jgi:hypothetical protein
MAQVFYAYDFGKFKVNTEGLAFGQAHRCEDLMHHLMWWFEHFRVFGTVEKAAAPRHSTRYKSLVHANT